MMICSLCLLPHGETGAPACAVCAYPGPAALADWPPDESMELIAAGQLGAAYARLEAEVRQGRESAESCRRLAWLSLAIEDIRAVEIWCHESLRLDPESAEPHVLLGYALLREGRNAESHEELEAALRRAMPDERVPLVRELRDQARSGLPEWD